MKTILLALIALMIVFHIGFTAYSFNQLTISTSIAAGIILTLELLLFKVIKEDNWD